MPDAPRPVTSPPAQQWQPYDATAGGESEYQYEPGTVYDEAPQAAGGHPWAKVADGGASPDFQRADGQWPSDGSSDGSKWKGV